ncbi:efflux RND transporter periplasmic adaptor subunit [Acidicapsa dinghuensis]|uniref:Efflux RND transporter periplasmic adaptor subunit n=1 Tax=Acidicapsa dinghuensis TaxID=2218256 RepID=A0ABW1EFQ5_9BACT|nr:efflux RND transporter periplasmic adaptor subunit [Acidicapsa dinghuensis]
MAETTSRQITGRVWLWIGAAVLLVVIFFVARNMTRDRTPVHAATASRTELYSTVPTNGIVEPVENYEYHAPAATSVRVIYAQQGQAVKAGTVLMQLDDVSARARVATAESALAAAQATLDATRNGGSFQEQQSLDSSISRARLDLADAQRQLAALQKLQASGAASASEVAAAQQRVALNQDNLNSFQTRQQARYAPVELQRAQSAVSDAQANLTAARAILNQMSYSAPIDGTVYSIPVGRSDYVEEGKLLLQMTNLSHLRVRAYFDEPEIGGLKIGQKIAIVWDARPGREWHGHITQVPSTIITYNTRNVGEVLVAIDDPDGGLLPDTHVTVTATTSSAPNSLTVPREALHSENGKPYVYRIVNDSLVRTSVVTGTLNLTDVAITSGLKDGDVVATGSLNGLPLEDGLPIKVVR